MREYRSVYTIPTEDGKNKVMSREFICRCVMQFGEFIGQVHYVDSKGRSTSDYDIILKSNKNSEGYIVSKNVKGETIGTLTSDSFLKGNDTRLIFGKNYCKSVEQMIQKRIQSRGVKRKKNNPLQILRDYLNSLNL